MTFKLRNAERKEVTKMENSKAKDVMLKCFDRLCGNYHYQNGEKIDMEDALWTAVQSLEKQIPKKGIMIGDNYSSVLSCPNCRKPIVNVWNIAKYEPNYCHYCGQALDWSDEK